MPTSFGARHRTICAVLQEIRASTTDPRIQELCDEAREYAERMSAKLVWYKEQLHIQLDN